MLYFEQLVLKSAAVLNIPTSVSSDVHSLNQRLFIVERIVQTFKMSCQGLTAVKPDLKNSHSAYDRQKLATLSAQLFSLQYCTHTG